MFSLCVYCSVIFFPFEGHVNLVLFYGNSKDKCDVYCSWNRLINASKAEVHILLLGYCVI